MMRWLVSRRSFRGVINLCYRGLSYPLMEGVHGRYSKLFRDYLGYFEEGEWQISFAGKKVKVHLESSEVSLDWEAALTLLGHDSEIKQTYETLLHVARPKVFFDIGTNYGTHSILFLVHGVQVVSFSPTPTAIPSSSGFAPLTP